MCLKNVCFLTFSFLPDMVWRLVLPFLFLELYVIFYSLSFSLILFVLVNFFFFFFAFLLFGFTVSSDECCLLITLLLSFCFPHCAAPCECQIKWRDFCKVSICTMLDQCNENLVPRAYLEPLLISFFSSFYDLELRNVHCIWESNV